ncbi:Amino acid transporter, transmembrane family-containing protein [Strongyloides ratti]|uniref:Amino acid transporter, transmembrane family-containing protein n=1 Tax=Strongyloides ratti TaxID=34506 RepID=A0A090KVT2_STRRB|nr:Amino acid transporter, transmembrane family-containing protein [Strongyloides ratti]CEF59362.1 Amino acid transporter, transmembrane family-containing protein [Strongyloides ratti]
MKIIMGLTKIEGKLNGLHWITTSLFIVADLAGGGVVAMPLAMVKSGLMAGLLIMIILFIVFTYTAHMLGQNWIRMCQNWPEYNEHCRKPYPEMALKSMGERSRTFTSFVINGMLFGVSIVYLLLASKIINDIVFSFIGNNVGSCIMLLIVASIMLPVTFLKSPQDFWWAIVVAMFTTLFAVIIIFSGTISDLKTCAPVANYPPFSIKNLFLSLGTFMFSFGGHAVFPTIQHDMKKPNKFTRSSIVAFILVLTMYIPVTVLGYMVYGDSVQDSIISSLQIPLLQNIANAFIAIHCILTLTIVINPLNQEVEHYLDIPHHFGWQRIGVRTFVMGIIVFTAETVPNFGPILNLIGGTCVTLTSALMPSFFYLFMETRLKMIRDNINEKKDENDIYPSILDVYKNTNTSKLIINSIIIILSLICGIATTISAINEMSDSQFSMPCYLKNYFGENDITTPKIIESFKLINCCGKYLNESRYNDINVCLNNISI